MGEPACRIGQGNSGRPRQGLSLAQHSNCLKAWALASDQPPLGDQLWDDYWGNGVQELTGLMRHGL